MKKRKLKDNIVKAFIWLCGIITVAVLAWILIYIISNGIGQLSLDFIFSKYEGGKHGIFSMILITVYVVLLSVIISTPVGIFAAIYLVEYSRQGKILKMIRFATETLAGIPSIIYGLFGFIFFVTVFKFGFSILAGALTLSIMVLPTIIRTTEEALKAVPVTYREGSLALGATKLQTIVRVILPSAIPGILTAVILSIGRIVGETAAVYLTAGTVSRIPESVMDSGKTLAVHLYVLAKEGISFEEAYATATVLIIIVGVINFTTAMIARRIKKVTTGH